MKKNELAVVSLVIYKIIYELIYMYAVSPIFGYMGLPYNPNTIKLIISCVMFGLIVAALPKHNAPVSRYLLAIFLVFTMIPLLSFYWQADAATEFMIYCVASYILLARIVCSPLKIKRTCRIVIDREIIGKVDVVLVQTLVIIFLLVLITVKYGVANMAALNLYDIYAVRESRSFTGIYGYIVNWIPYALVPCLICTSLYMKRWGYTCFAVVVQLYMYLLLGSKTALFSVALILASYFFVKMGLNYICIWSAVLVFLNTFTLVVWKLLGMLMPFGIFPVRLLSIPASISFEHYEFFSKNPKLHFCENLIGRILGIESPYNQISTFLVSDGKSNHCTGYLGDAYDNGGFAVMLLYSIILAIVLRMVDKIYLGMGDNKKEQLPMFVGILTYSMIYLNDGTLTALMVTGGLVLTLFFFAVLENKVYIREKRGVLKGFGKNAKEL